MTVTAAPQHEVNSKSKVLIPTLLVVLGILVMMYPVVSTQWNNLRQQRVATEYAELEKSADPAQLNKMLEDAREYNKTRQTGPILDPWLERIAKDNAEYRQYTDQLGGLGTMARLVVPTAKIDLPVYHGTEDDTLKKGVGHLFGSDLPVGGEGSHAVLTGHTGLPNATLFDNLKSVKEGDAIYIQVSGEKLKYEVDQIKVVLPHEVNDLKPVEGQDLVTLVTCTPYGINSHRLLVRGHRVPMEEVDRQAMEKSHGAMWQWWMWLLIGVVVAVGAGLVLWLLRQRRGHYAEGDGTHSATYLIKKYEMEQRSND